MEVYLGIDSSQAKHDIVFMNPQGVDLARACIPHSPEGFLQLEALRQELGLSPSDCLVGLESAHSLLVDFLWDQGYVHVYVIPPHVVKASRGRYGHSGARTDPSDASLQADLLRTDRARLQPWFPDSLATRQIRAWVSLIDHLTQSIVRHANRLRAVLFRYYPAALELFSDLTSQISLQFIQAYPTPQAAADVDWPQFEAFAQAHHYPHPKHLRSIFSRLQTPQPQPAASTILAYQQEASLLAALLLNLVRAKAAALRELEVLFHQHPDSAIFASLPGAGDYLAPALLAKFGDDRQRFPTPASAQALAGTCPVTDSSGKRRRVMFRRACDRQFRRIAQQWARCSLVQSTWANAYWHQVRPRCSSDSHAFRCLANRWLAVAWKLWQTRQPYDESYHLRQRKLHARLQA
jgi:transposase